MADVQHRTARFRFCRGGVLDLECQDQHISGQLVWHYNGSSWRVFFAVNRHSYLLQWHDTLWTLRHLLFLFLPLTVHFLCPASTFVSPLAMVPMTNLALQSLMRRIQLMKFTNGATARVPELRQATGEFWEKTRSEGRWAREDESLNKTAEFSGAALPREGARQIAMGWKQGYEPDVFVR